MTVVNLAVWSATMWVALFQVLIIIIRRIVTGKERRLSFLLHLGECLFFGVVWIQAQCRTACHCQGSRQRLCREVICCNGPSS